MGSDIQYSHIGNNNSEPSNEVVPMSVRERILTIRLLNKILENPERAKELGIEGIIAEVHSK